MNAFKYRMNNLEYRMNNLENWKKYLHLLITVTCIINYHSKQIFTISKLLTLDRPIKASFIKLLLNTFILFQKI